MPALTIRTLPWLKLLIFKIRERNDSAYRLRVHRMSHAGTARRTIKTVIWIIYFQTVPDTKAFRFVHNPNSNVIRINFNQSAFQAPLHSNTPQHVPLTTNNLPTSETNNSIDSTDPDRVIFRGGATTNSTNVTDNGIGAGGNDQTNAAEDEPIAPIRPPIHSKTKNWYSSYCNRWASLIGVRDD